MELFIIYLIIFSIVLCLYLLYFKLVSKYKPNHKFAEIIYLESKYNKKINKKDKPLIYVFISIINSMVLTISYATFYIVDNIFIQIPITLITVVVTIYLFYSILGNYYKKKR